MQTKNGSSHYWLKMLEESKVRHLLLDPKTDLTLMEVLQSEPAWEVDTADDEFVFFIRKEEGVEKP